MERERIRNFGVAAHIDAGKTTVSERMLYFTGVEHRVGQVDEGTAVMDWMPEERERGITITAAATTLPWRGHALNLIDTPGHVDFTVEVERAMRVLDGAVLVLDGVVGVQAQSETVWRQVQRHRVPALVFVNKLDRPGADYLNALETLRARLAAPAVPVQWPIYEAGALALLVDLVRLVVWDFRGSKVGLEASDQPIPAAAADDVGVLRAELLDRLAQEDEAILQALLEEREPTVQQVLAALRLRVIGRTLVPVLCGAALRDIGIQPLLDAIVDFLPSPLDAPPIVGRDPQSAERVERLPDPAGPFTALAFKLHVSSHGDLTFVRVYSGTVEPGQVLLNPRGSRRERVQRILRMHADAQTPLERAYAGDIVALTGLKFTSTGDTLCAPDAPIVLEQLEVPEPVITRVVEPTSASDRDRLREALSRLEHEDPSFRVIEDEDSGQWQVSGMGELHLEVMLHRLAREGKLEPQVGKPRVAYREAVVGAGSGAGRIERQMGGKEVFAEVELTLWPDAQRAQLAVEAHPDCGLPPVHRDALFEALRLEASVGPRFGFPLVNARIEILAARSRPGREDESGYVQAGIAALRQAMQAGEIVLLEPLMDFRIDAPAEFASGVIADLNARQAEITEVRSDGLSRHVAGLVPLVSMFGYATAVRSLSQGRASFSMTPAGFRRVSEAELAARGLTWT
jgi:elongation factor G